VREVRFPEASTAYFGPYRDRAFRLIVTGGFEIVTMDFG
jgi:hypothetical protein